MLQEADGGLLRQLEGITEGLLPEMLLSQPHQRWPQDSQSAFLTGLKKFAVAMLRYRYRSAKHLGYLRGLMKSLLDGMSSLRMPCACTIARRIHAHKTMTCMQDLACCHKLLPHVCLGPNAKSGSHAKSEKFSYLWGMLAGSCSCPAAADLAADLAELILLHSEFQPLMTQRSEEPLPKASAQLAAPLTSLLPLVTIHPGSQQQVSAQPCTWLQDSPK